MRKYYSFMIKPASSLCNMRCKYCFYHDIAGLREVRSYGVMEYDLIDGFLSRIHDELSDYDSLNIAFQGGEPSLAGLEWFGHFVKEIDKWTKKIKVSYAFQTIFFLGYPLICLRIFMMISGLIMNIRGRIRE